MMNYLKRNWKKNISSKLNFYSLVMNIYWNGEFEMYYYAEGAQALIYPKSFKQSLKSERRKKTRQT